MKYEGYLVEQSKWLPAENIVHAQNMVGEFHASHPNWPKLVSGGTQSGPGVGYQNANATRINMIIAGTPTLATDSYRVAAKEQFRWTRTSFLYLDGRAIPHCQDSSLSTTTKKLKKPNNHPHAPLGPLHSVKLLLHEVSPARLLVVHTTSDTGVKMVAF
jgi:hypothetical protein